MSTRASDKPRASHLSRRQMLQLGAGVAGSVLRPSFARAENAQDDLLEEIERRACLYFMEQADPATGLIRDRARTEGREERIVASIAATGFGLSALCIADQRDYIKTAEALKRVKTTLTFLAGPAPHKRGFFYHFLGMTDGKRAWGSELSSIDTAWLLCGVLHAREHFDNSEVRQLSADILERVDWRWMLNGGDTLSHGWTPEQGFLSYRWDRYSEHLAMYLLAIGTSGFPIDASCWDSWKRPAIIKEGIYYIESMAPLFVHQYSHAWFDFYQRQDRYADYFDNSRRATEAHRRFCLRLSNRYPWYGDDMWGVTASDSRQGYIAWGGDTQAEIIDGSLVPCAAGGSIVFLPNQCRKVLATMLERYGKKAWGRYGFVDAFHPKDNWYSPDVIGIDQGIMLLMAENLRTGSVWDAVMSAPEAQRALDAVGFRKRDA